MPGTTSLWLLLLHILPSRLVHGFPPAPGEHAGRSGPTLRTPVSHGGALEFTPAPQVRIGPHGIPLSFPEGQGARCRLRPSAFWGSYLIHKDPVAVLGSQVGLHGLQGEKENQHEQKQARSWQTRRLIAETGFDKHCSWRCFSSRNMPSPGVSSGCLSYKTHHLNTDV